MVLLNHSVRLTPEWKTQDYDGIYPKGARDKELYISPESPTDKGIRPNWLYLFKRAFQRHPWQFWVEIIAYRISLIIGVDVPPAHLGCLEQPDGTCDFASLIEWFYDADTEGYIDGGNVMVEIIEDFDRKKGTQHNLISLLGDPGERIPSGLIVYVNQLLAWLYEKIPEMVEAELKRIIGSEDVEVLPEKNELDTLGIQIGIAHWAKMLTFDTLIGNTDRHQDNWGLIWGKLRVDDPVRADEDKDSLGSIHIKWPFRFSPAFDNGTALGYEILEEKMVNYQGEKLRSYLTNPRRARHHMHWCYPPENQSMNFYQFVTRFRDTYQETHDMIVKVLDFSADQILDALLPLVEMSNRAKQMPADQKLTRERIEFITRLVIARRDLLRKELGA